MKRIWLFSLLSLLLAGCTERGLNISSPDGRDPSGGPLVFSASLVPAVPDGSLTKAADPVDFGPQGVGLYLHSFVSAFPEGLFSGRPSTKSAPVGQLHASMRVSGYAFTGPWSGSQKANLFFAQSPSPDGDGRWTVGGGYRWLGDDYTYRFYAVSPESVAWEGDGTEEGGPMIAYTLSSDVAAQVDVLEAVSGDCSGVPSASVPLSFRHALCALQFVVSDFGADVHVSGISVEGLYSRGRHAVGSSFWTDLSVPSSWEMTTDVDVPLSGRVSLTGGEQTLLMIPQECPDGAKVVMRLSRGGKDYAVECPLAGTVLSPGKLYTMVLTPEASGWLFEDLVVTGQRPVPSTLADGAAFGVAEVISYRLHSSGLTMELPWRVAGYREQGQAEFVPERPSWFSSCTEGGPGGQTPQAFEVSLSDSRYTFRSCEVLLRTEGDSPREKAVTVVTTGDEMLTFEVRTTSGETGHIYFQESNHNWYHPELEYSRDGGLTWTSLPAWDGTGGSDIEVRVGDVLLLRGDNPRMACDGNVNGTSFFSTDEGTTFWCSGDLASLIDRNAYASTRGTFTYLFDGCKGCLNHPGKDIYCSLESLVPNMFNGTFRGSGVTRCMELPWQGEIPSLCFRQMYANTGIREAMEVLPGSTLGGSAYESLFQGCTELRRAPRILATTLLSGKEFYSMFEGCSSLVHAPVLGVENLTPQCCARMFINCSSLTDYPADFFGRFDSVPAYGFNSMFSGCTSLRIAPDLPATTVDRYAYYSMFEGCSNLEVGPAELPAAVVPLCAYQSMFKGCSRLRESPYWGVRTVEQQGMYQMFSNCTSLAVVQDMQIASQSGFKSMSYMFAGCTSLKAFPSSLPATQLSEDCYNSMFSGCISLKVAPALPATTLSVRCYYEMFKGCSSLEEAPRLPATTLASYCYYGMFSNCVSLKKAPDLPATALAAYCYYRMFMDCTSLEEASALPAVELASYCYGQMFYRCSSLLKAPDLPSVSLVPNCYYQMFGGCSSLVEGPALPATTLSERCYYYMFDGCISLRKAPDLPAMALAPSCYYAMFSNCKALEACPDLPATTLSPSCYFSMFHGCSLLSESPVLSAATLVENCYRDMFAYTRISLVTCLATDVSAPGCTYRWFDNNIVRNGVFRKAPGMESWTRGVDGILETWVVEDYI